MNPHAVLLAVDTIVQSIRHCRSRLGHRDYRRTALALLPKSRDYPMGGPIWTELRARAGRFRRAGERQEARKKENAA